MSERIKVEKNIFQDINYKKPFTWKDIKHLELEDDDVIWIGYNDAYYTENNSMDAHYYCTITRMVDETDEQMKKRIEKEEMTARLHKKRRREAYEKLKKEFEGEDSK